MGKSDGNTTTAGVEQILQYQPEIQMAIAQRVRATQLIAEAEALKESADTILYAAMETYEVKKIFSDYGEFQKVDPSTSSRLDKDRLREHLVNAGVAAGVVGSCFEKATKAESRKGYIKFNINKALPVRIPNEMEVASGK